MLNRAGLVGTARTELALDSLGFYLAPCVLGRVLQNVCLIADLPCLYWVVCSVDRAELWMAQRMYNMVLRKEGQRTKKAQEETSW